MRKCRFLAQPLSPALGYDFSTCSALFPTPSPPDHCQPSPQTVGDPSPSCIPITACHPNYSPCWVSQSPSWIYTQYQRASSSEKCSYFITFLTSALHVPMSPHQTSYCPTVSLGSLFLWVRSQSHGGFLKGIACDIYLVFPERRIVLGTWHLSDVQWPEGLMSTQALTSLYFLQWWEHFLILAAPFHVEPSHPSRTRSRSSQIHHEWMEISLFICT